MDVGMQLKSLPDENEGKQTVNIIHPGRTVRIVIAKPPRTILLNAFDEAVDDLARIVFFRKPEAKSRDGFGDGKSLKVIVMVGSGEKATVKLFAGGIKQAFPNGISFLGCAERKQTERGIGHAVIIRIFDKGLLGDASRGQVIEVVFPQLNLPGGPKEFTNRQGCMTRFVHADLFAGCRGYCPVFVDVLQVVAQKGTSKIEALIGKIMH